MLSKTIHDGVVFVGECFNRLFTPGELRCPHCDGVLREETAKAGEAYLVCTSEGKDCGNPIKNFVSSRHLYQWRDTTWELIARSCRQQS